jgi:hypothetical protein
MKCSDNRDRMKVLLITKTGPVDPHWLKCCLFPPPVSGAFDSVTLPFSDSSGRCSAMTSLTSTHPSFHSTIRFTDLSTATGHSKFTGDFFFYV